jgi:hypothetical protein
LHGTWRRRQPRRLQRRPAGARRACPLTLKRRPRPCACPPQVQIINKEGLREANREEEGFIIKDGIVVVVKNALIKDGTVI